MWGEGAGEVEEPVERPDSCMSTVNNTWIQVLRLKRTLTINIGHAGLVGSSNPLPPIPQNRLLQKSKTGSHTRQRLGPHLPNFSLLPAAPRVVFPILLELRVFEEWQFGRDELCAPHEYTTVNGPFFEKLGESAYRDAGGAQTGIGRGWGEKIFELEKDKAGVAVDVAAYGEDRDAAVFDAGVGIYSAGYFSTKVS